VAMAGKPNVALVAGVGDGLGGAVARRLAREGHPTVLVARNAERLARIAGEIAQAGGRGIAYVADLRDEAAVAKLFDDVEASVGPIDVAVFNTGANYRASILDTPADMFEKVWRLGCYAGFLVGREAARHMVPRGQGRSSSRARRRACAGRRISRRSPQRRAGSGRSRRRWRGSSGRRASTSPR